MISLFTRQPAVVLLFREMSNVYWKNRFYTARRIIDNNTTTSLADNYSQSVIKIKFSLISYRNKKPQYLLSMGLFYVVFLA